MVREFSSFRLDLYLIGLLWLKFFNVKFDHLIKKEFSLQAVRDNIDNLLKSINIEKKPDLINKLLDLKNYSWMTIDEVLLTFNENYIIENLATE